MRQILVFIVSSIIFPLYAFSAEVAGQTAALMPASSSQAGPPPLPEAITGISSESPVPIENSIDSVTSRVLLPAALAGQRDIVGIANTLMEDHFEPAPGQHFMHTIVETDNGEVIRVNTGSHDRFVGQRVSWRVRDSAASQVAAAALSGGFAVDARMKNADLVSILALPASPEAAPSPGPRLRRLGTVYPVTPMGPRTIIAIRVNVTDGATGAVISPSFCDEACTWVSACTDLLEIGC
jgi:hypothetical protein